MRIELNGDPRDVAADTTVAVLIESIAGSGRGSAAVVDGEVVPRSEWAAYALRAGQSVEIVTAVQGG